MILHSLYRLYQRRSSDPDPARRLPAFGYVDKGIPYLIVIDGQGQFVTVQPTLSGDKKPVSKDYLVPMGVKKTSGIAANLFWDTVEYALGIDTRGNPARVAEQHAAFRARIRALNASAQEDEGMIALNRFLDQLEQARSQRAAAEANPQAAAPTADDLLAQLEQSDHWDKLINDNPIVSFRLANDATAALICQRAAVMPACLPVSGPDDPQGMCLITGDEGPIQETHPAIRGVWGAQTAGANIVSFNADAYCSFGKNGLQGANAPVGQLAAFGYTTALNDLLRQGSRQRAQVADASTVFWTSEAQDDAFAETFATLFGGNAKPDNPAEGADDMRAALEWLNSGGAMALDAKRKFYVLGLGPNAARLSIRFWRELTIAQMAERTRNWFQDIRIAGPDWVKPHPPLTMVLREVAVQKKIDNIPPNLGGAVMQAVLDGGGMPATLYQAAVRRCRAETEVTPFRAGILKACLLRQSLRAWRAAHSSKPEDLLVNLTPDLPEAERPAYNMGRLFAVLERLQGEAINDPNATIRDRYFGSAMSTPAMVFTSLLKLHNHHLSKLRKTKNGSGFFDKLLGEIMGEINHKFPRSMKLEYQGLFCLGYYHQRQEFYKPGEKGAAAAANSAAADDAAA